MISAIKNFDLIYKVQMAQLEEETHSKLHFYENKLAIVGQILAKLKKRMSNMTQLIIDYRDKFAFLKNHSDCMIVERDQRIYELRKELEFFTIQLQTYSTLTNGTLQGTIPNTIQTAEFTLNTKVPPNRLGSALSQVEDATNTNNLSKSELDIIKQLSSNLKI